MCHVMKSYVCSFVVGVGGMNPNPDEGDISTFCTPAIWNLPLNLFTYLEFLSTCNQTMNISEGRFSTYTYRATMPYYNSNGPKNTTCLHRIEGIPAGAILAVSITDGYYRYYDPSRYNQHFTISNGTHQQYIFDNEPPVFMRQLDGTNSLLLNFTASGSNRSWQLKYKYTGKW